jgi:hypothetical protein
MAGEVFVPSPSGTELEVKVIEELWGLSSALRRPLRRHCVGAGSAATFTPALSREERESNAFASLLA